MLWGGRMNKDFKFLWGGVELSNGISAEDELVVRNGPVLNYFSDYPKDHPEYSDTLVHISNIPIEGSLDTFKEVTKDLSRLKGVVDE